MTDFRFAVGEIRDPVYGQNYSTDAVPTTRRDQLSAVLADTAHGHMIAALATTLKSHPAALHTITNHDVSLICRKCSHELMRESSAQRAE